MMKISVLYCSLEGVMEALPLTFTRDSLSSFSKICSSTSDGNSPISLMVINCEFDYLHEKILKVCKQMTNIKSLLGEALGGIN